jgi:hypothetical protein
MDEFGPQKGESHVVDDCRNTLNTMDAWASDRLCDGFCYPHNLRSRGCTAGGQSQSRGDDQPEVATCIAKSRPKTRWQAEARTISRPTDTVKDYALRYRMDAIVMTTHIDTKTYREE